MLYSRLHLSSLLYEPVSALCAQHCGNWCMKIRNWRSGQNGLWNEILSRRKTNKTTMRERERGGREKRFIFWYLQFCEKFGVYIQIRTFWNNQVLNLDHVNYIFSYVNLVQPVIFESEIYIFLLSFILYLSYSPWLFKGFLLINFW